MAMARRLRLDSFGVGGMGHEDEPHPSPTGPGCVTTKLGRNSLKYGRNKAISVLFIVSDHIVVDVLSRLHKPRH